jgi:two-component system response regulator VicR
MKKILVAEDDKFLVNVLLSKLSKEGFEVIHAFDGEEALAKVCEKKPDLVLLDLVIPVKDGFEVLKEIKADEALKDIPVIILSNLGQDEDIKRGQELGAEDYLVKTNLSLGEVVEKIKQHLSQ